MVSPTIQLSAKLCRDKFGLAKRNGHEPLPATHTVQPTSPKPGLIKQTMNVGAPDTTILTCSAFIALSVAFPDFRWFNLKTWGGSSTTGTAHVDFITTDWRVPFHIMQQRCGADLPTDLWRIKLRRYVEKP